MGVGEEETKRNLAETYPSFRLSAIIETTRQRDLVVEQVLDRASGEAGGSWGRCARHQAISSW
jgi:hypothetical protein